MLMMDRRVLVRLWQDLGRSGALGRPFHFVSLPISLPIQFNVQVQAQVQVQVQVEIKLQTQVQVQVRIRLVYSSLFGL